MSPASLLLLLLYTPPLWGAADTQPWRPLQPRQDTGQHFADLIPQHETDPLEKRKQNQNRKQNRKQAKESGFHSSDFLHAFGSNIFHLVTQPFNAISEHDFIYDAEEKTFHFGDLQLSLIFAIEEFLLIMTEMVAYIATDQLMRAVWPV